ncbi:MAG: hypothetical protein KDD04_08915 [Sinomicrobium sp.]|nr:hypothetical protein [Sinomicrobium sp.]
MNYFLALSGYVAGFRKYKLITDKADIDAIASIGGVAAIQCCCAIRRYAPHGTATGRRSAPALCTYSALRSEQAHNTAPTPILHSEKIFSLRENFYLHEERRRAPARWLPS